MSCSEGLQVARHKGGHNMSVVSHLHMKHCESDAGDVRTLFMSSKNRSGEPLSKNPIRMQGIYQIFDVACSWLRGLVKNDGTPSIGGKTDASCI